MLKIDPVVLEVIAALRPILAQVGRHDVDLARRLRRAASSVALNTAEGMYSRGKNRTVRYHTALGSVRETRACLEVAAAFGYLGPIDNELGQCMDYVIGSTCGSSRARCDRALTNDSHAFELSRLAPSPPPPPTLPSPATSCG